LVEDLVIVHSPGKLYSKLVARPLLEQTTNVNIPSMRTTGFAAGGVASDFVISRVP
jgi:hypothetical protein